MCRESGPSSVRFTFCLVVFAALQSLRLIDTYIVYLDLVCGRDVHDCYVDIIFTSLL